MGHEDHAQVDLPLLALLQRAVRWFSDELLAQLAEAGVDPITPAHATVLSHLDDRRALSIAELARRAGVSRQTMHRSVIQLVDEGLLISTPGSGFPRTSVIKLTATGRQRHAIARQILTDLEQTLSAELRTRALADLRANLEQVWLRPRSATG